MLRIFSKKRWQSAASFCIILFMVSLFLCEDEIVMREGIRDRIDWKAENIDFVGEASDGEMAIPAIMEKKPDILITDIKMPFVDGLMLSEVVKKNLPDTKIMILSGYDEFEYARRAVSLGVTEYLLKPISPKKLLESIRKVRDTVLEERSHKEYVTKLIENAGGDGAPVHKKEEKKFHSRSLTAAVKFIDSNFSDEDISLNKVADHVGVSPNHLSSTFSKELGSTFIEYLTKCRIDRAKELLTTTDLRSSEVAYEVGYKDPHYFSAAFKKACGMTPKEYRNSKP